MSVCCAHGMLPFLRNVNNQGPVCTLTFCICTFYRKDYGLSVWFVVVSPSSGREALVLRDEEMGDGVFFFWSTVLCCLFTAGW